MVRGWVCGLLVLFSSTEILSLTEKTCPHDIHSSYLLSSKKTNKQKRKNTIFLCLMIFQPCHILPQLLPALFFSLPSFLSPDCCSFPSPDCCSFPFSLAASAKFQKDGYILPLSPVRGLVNQSVMPPRSCYVPRLFNPVGNCSPYKY